MKGFLFLLIGALVLGGGLGGAFAGGVALGRSQGQEQGQSSPATQASRSEQQASSAAAPEQPGQSRQRPATEGLDPEGSSQLPSQTPGSSPPGFSVWGGLAGTIEKVEGATATINTAQGLVQVAVGAGTVVQRPTRGTVADLQAGVRVTVFGQRKEDGTVVARRVLLIPEGDGGFFR